MVLRFFRPFLPGGLPRLGAIPGASEPPKIVLSSLVSASICSRRPTARRSCASDKSDNAFAIAVISHENVREVNFAPANRNAPLLFAIHGDSRLHFGPPHFGEHRHGALGAYSDAPLRAFTSLLDHSIGARPPSCHSFRTRVF